MAQPLVTVLMPAYNAEKYLRESIESILNQSFKDFEFLIIDDGSTDNSVDIINSFKDKRIRLVKNNENLKLIATLNKGIELSYGKYICRTDADDISMSNRIEKQFAFMENNHDYVACSTGVELFYEDNTRKILLFEEDNDEIRIKTLYQNHFCHPGSFIKRDFINEKNLRFDKRFIHSEDYFFFVKLSEIGKIYNIREPLVRVRKHKANVSVLNSEMQLKNSINVIIYQLNKIGIDTADINYKLYYRFFYSSFDLKKEEIEAMEKLLIRIIDANNMSNYLPHQKLIDFLCDKWYHLCLNTTNHGLWIYEKFNNSELSKHIQINKFNKIKFIIKSSIKYQH